MGESLNVLIVPLIGGFIFVISSKIFRHRVLRHDGQYLFFLSATFGLFFLISSYFLTMFIGQICPQGAILWSKLVPFKYSGTAFGSLIIALLSAIPFVLMPRQKVISYIIKDEGDAIENMIWEAMNKALLVCVTLDTDKVYVGFVSNPPESAFTRLKTISLVPKLSGYRDKDKNIRFENYYEGVVEEIRENTEGDTITNENINVGIPLSRIVSINYFDPVIYEYLSEKNEEEPSIT